jgi:hypothetical protein
MKLRREIEACKPPRRRRPWITRSSERMPPNRQGEQILPNKASLIRELVDGDVRRDAEEVLSIIKNEEER